MAASHTSECIRSNGTLHPVRYCHPYTCPSITALLIQPSTFNARGRSACCRSACRTSSLRMQNIRLASSTAHGTHPAVATLNEWRRPSSCDQDSKRMSCGLCCITMLFDATYLVWHVYSDQVSSQCHNCHNTHMREAGHNDGPKALAQIISQSLQRKRYTACLRRVDIQQHRAQVGPCGHDWPTRHTCEQPPLFAGAAQAAAWIRVCNVSSDSSTCCARDVH